MARILVAEDDDAVRAFVSRALMIDGHEIETAEDGAAALDVLKEDEHFDMLLSDVKMPVMDGIALALNVARDHPHIPILLMTGYADQRERANGMEEIIKDVVQKPFTLAQIRGAVADVLADQKNAA